MSPTSRNTLLIGGALIVVALLLTCGPMLGWFGGTDDGVATLPPVASGPPEDAAETLDAATAGAIAGAEAGLVDGANLDGGKMGGGGMDRGEALAMNDLAKQNASGLIAGGAAGASAGKTAGGASGNRGRAAGAVGAGAAAAGAGAAAATSAAGAGSSAAGAAAGATSALPPVSAGVPSTDVAGPALASTAAMAAAEAAAATRRFDDTFSSGFAGEPDISAAGLVVDRFAPPVAAFGGSPLALAAASDRFGADAGGVRDSCDGPGAGCRNVRGAGRVPPLIPGVRPVLPPNPPIIPGQRPVPGPGQI